jgi:PAS domain S-box-containing protein
MSFDGLLEPAATFPAQSLLDALPLAVYVCKSPSGEILRFNHVARELWGGAPRPGTTLCGAMRLFLPDGTPLPVEQCPMAFAVRDGTSYADQYVLMQRADGLRFIANVNIAPIHDREGKLVGAINAFQDVTARRRSEMLLASQRTLLEHIVSGAPLDEVLQDAARAAELYALGHARAVVFVVDGARLRLAAAPGVASESAAGLASLAIHSGSAAEDAVPRALAEAGAMRRLAHIAPARDARQQVSALIALYEPDRAGVQRHSYEGLELLSRTVALALERRALVEAEERALDRRDESLLLAQQAAAAARETAERFRMLLEGLPAAAYTCDAQGRITYFNRRAAQLWGREPRLNDPRDLYCGSHRLFLAEGSPIAHSECWMALALKEGRRYEGREIRIERPDGEVGTALAYAMPFRDESGALAGAVNVLVDISERKAAESTLRASEERLRAIVDTTPECVKLVGPDGTLLQMNASGLAMVGAESADQVVGQSVYGLIAPEDRAAFIAFNERICRGERGSLEFDVIALDGPRRHMETHAAPFAIGAGRLAQLAITRDMTERRRAQAERERIVAALAESDRRKDEFIATLSHELRNPLAPLKASVDLLGHAGQQRPETMRALQPVMARQVAHLVRLVDDLLESSRITRGTFELRKQRIALDSVVRQAVETSKPSLDAAGHHLDVSTPGETLWLDGDGVRLVQILSNLLNNAAKYTDPNGRVSLQLWREGDQALVVVRDNGVGIASDMAPRLFEMFARSDYAGHGGKSGLGVGLALARRLAEMHGGTLEARSDGPGKGSEFALRLPLAEAQVAPPACAPACSAVLRPAGEQVLVVDDNGDAGDMLGMLLQAAGAEARVARDGAEALDMVERLAPSVAFLDIGMPGMDGYELARAIRKRHARPIVLVAVTGWGQDHDRQKAFAAGFDHHIVKPADLDDLVPILNAAQEKVAATRAAEA